MPEEHPDEIAIGEHTYKIHRFKGLKASLAGSLMSRVMREVPQLQERATEFRRHFRETNTIIITPAMAKLPKFEPLGLTDADFRTSNGKVEFPEEPEVGAVLVNIFPDIFDLANKELQKFLAILVISNTELEEADDADEVDEALAKLGKRLMRQGDIDELLELLVVGMEVFKEQMSRKRDRLGKIQIPFIQNLLGVEEKPERAEYPETMEEPGEKIGPGETPLTPTETSPSPSPNSMPDSSSDLLPDSGGTEPLFSTESPGTS